MGAGKRKVLIPIVLVIVAILSLTLGSTLGAQAHDRSYRATLSIEHIQEHDSFEGNLDTAGICTRGRLISVYQVRSGNDRLVGRDNTDNHGDYVVENPAGLTGRFYAFTRVSSRGDGYFHHHLCKGDRSKPIKLAGS